MKKICLYTCFYLLVSSLPEAGRATEIYPQIQVVANVKGQIFDDISPSRLEELRQDVQKRVGETFGESLSFRCMKWIAKRGSSKTKIQAQLLVELSQRNQDLSWIDLSFSGVVEGAQPVPLWRAPGVAATWDRSWSKRNLKGLSDQVVRAVKAELLNPELRRNFNCKFIANIPIASSIHIERLDQRIVVPLNAKQLNLEPENHLKLELVASLCPFRPKGGCRIGLLSDAPWNEDLRCRLDTISCCRHQGWSSEVAKQLEKWEEREPATSELYLAGDHRHCQMGPEHCPGPDGIYRHPGS